MLALSIATLAYGVTCAALSLYSGIITAIVAASAVVAGWLKEPILEGRLVRLAVAYACIVSLAASPRDYLFEIMAGYYILASGAPCSCFSAWASSNCRALNFGPPGARHVYVIWAANQRTRDRYLHGQCFVGRDRRRSGSADIGCSWGSLGGHLIAALAPATISWEQRLRG